jgi:hypothetical protein
MLPTYLLILEKYYILLLGFSLCKRYLTLLIFGENLAVHLKQNFILLIYLLMILLPCSYLFSQTTIYVNNVTGSDLRDGLSSTILQPDNGISGPKQALSNAIIAAAYNDTICVANSGLVYSEGNILTDKSIAFKSDGGMPTFSEAITFGIQGQTQVQIKFVSSFKFNKGIILVNCLLSGGNFVYTENEILRSNLSQIISGNLNITGPTNLHYINYSSDSVTIITGNEFPQSELINKLNTSSAGGGTLTLKLNQSKTIHNSLTASGPIDLASNALNLNGYKHTLNGNITNGTISFNGSVDDTISGFPYDLALDRIMINKNDKTNRIILENNVLIKGLVTFINGLVVTANNIITIPAPLKGNGQGFDRSQVIGNRLSHIVGNVAKTLVNFGTIETASESRQEFPIGSSNHYMQAAITFNSVSGIPTIPGGATLIIEHNDKDPSEFYCLPIRISEGIFLINFPELFWTIRTAPSSISPSTYYDLEFICEGFTGFDDINNLKIIYSNGGDKCSTLAGYSLYYDNNVIGGIPSVVARNVTAGLITASKTYTVGTVRQDIVIGKIRDTTFSGCFEKPLKYYLPNCYHFRGVVGNLIYSAVSKDTTVATVKVIKDTLYVTCVGIGNATITLKFVDDATNDFLIDEFTVTIDPPTEFDINGSVTYNNTLSSPLKDVIVTLNPGELKDTTDSYGNFSFVKVPNGNYSLSAVSASAWAGANATDALNVAKHYAGILTLTGLALEAADVNNNSAVNNTDALIILRRFVNNTISFTKGNWILESKTVNINGTDAQVELKGLAVGDVNSSNVP